MAEHVFDSPGAEKLLDAAVDAVAWALIENSMDTSDRGPGREVYLAAVAQARETLPRIVNPKPVELFRGESEPVATNPVLRGVDLAIDRLVREDCFTERTLRVLDELRAEVLGVTTPDEVRAHYPAGSVLPQTHEQEQSNG